MRQFKTKALMVGCDISDLSPPVNLSGMPVEHVTAFKLLDTHVASDLKCSQHIDAITSKAASRLHFLKQLKRSGAGSYDLLYFYIFIRHGDPVITGVCLSYVALQPNCRTDEGARVARCSVE